MLSWQWPYLFLLLPLPLLLRWLVPARESAMGAIRVPFYAALQTLAQEQRGHASNNILLGLLVSLVWICLVAAAARPTWVGEPVNLPQERRDLMLAVDISKSMQEEDMQLRGRYVQRIDAVKEVVGNFIDKRSGDRIGLILFGEQGYLQTPLTYDSKTVVQQLKEARLGFAGNATAIGDTIGLAIKKLRDRPEDSRVLILLTDGANTAGSDPLQAADIATEAKIRIHTVSIGSDRQGVKDLFGRAIAGTSSNSAFDEETLISIAQKTGGQYFRARNPKELTDIYAKIDELEPSPEDQSFRPTISLTHWPVALALLLSGLLSLLLGRLNS